MKTQEPSPEPSKTEEDAKAPEESPFDWLAFVDAYGGYNLNEPSRRQEPSSLRAFDVHNGFAIAWAGLNLAYRKGPAAANVQLRFGPSSRTYNSNEEDVGLGRVKQAFLSYRPAFLKEKWAVDFGKFDTPFGAEVADSQENHQYTRGALNWLGQPFFHTGLRIQGEITPKFSILALAVNGWNRSLDNNRGKSFGLQLQTQPLPWLSVSLGYLGGPENSQRSELDCPPGEVFIPVRGCVVSVREDEPSENRHGEVNAKGVGQHWRSFADLLISAQPTDKLEILVNANYAYDELILEPISGDFRVVSWYGAMLSAKYQFTERWSASARGEWFEDPNGAAVGMMDAAGLPLSTRIFTATASAGFRPDPRLVFKLDARHDFATQSVFAFKDDGFRPQQTTFSIGAVVKTK